MIRLTAVTDAVRIPGDYLAVGQTYIRGGLIGGTAHREASSVHLQGTVRFGLNDPFNFRLALLWQFRFEVG